MPSLKSRSLEPDVLGIRGETKACMKLLDNTLALSASSSLSSCGVSLVPGIIEIRRRDKRLREIASQTSSRHACCNLREELESDTSTHLSKGEQRGG